MRKRINWELLADISLALKDVLASNAKYFVEALFFAPVQKSLVKAVSGEYKGAQRLFTARLLSRRAVDGAFLDGPVAIGYAKFAIRKGMPGEGEKRMAIENEPHTVNDFDGEIKEGYGKGTKKLMWSGNAVIKVGGGTPKIGRVNIHSHRADRAGLHYDFVAEGVPPGTKQFEVNIPSGEYRGRYAFIRPSTFGDGQVLITRMKDRSIVLPKPVFRLIDIPKLESIDENPEDWIAEWKPDGGMAIANIVDSRAVFTSHRPQAPAYYDKLPQVEWLMNKSTFFTSRWLFPNADIDNTILFVELFHPQGAARVGGIVNANADNSIRLQQDRGPVSVIIWGISRYKGKDVSSLPYAERRILAERAGRQISNVNPYWSVVPVKRGGGFMKFYHRIVTDKRGLPFSEGIVLKRGNDISTGGYKVKHRDTYDVEVVDVLEGTGKYKNSAGKLVVRSVPDGPLGEVGSLAVPDEQRDWIWQHRNKLPGQVAEIFAQEITQQGVPRAGVFYRWHPSKSDFALKMYNLIRRRK